MTRYYKDGPQLPHMIQYVKPGQKITHRVRHSTATEAGITMQRLRERGNQVEYLRYDPHQGVYVPDALPVTPSWRKAAS